MCAIFKTRRKNEKIYLVKNVKTYFSDILHYPINIDLKIYTQYTPRKLVKF